MNIRRANHITYTTQNAYGRRSFSLGPTQTQHQSCGLAESCIDKTRCGLPWRRAPIHRRFGGCTFKIQHTNIVNASSNNFEGSHQALSFKDCEIKECLHRRGESQQSTKRRCLHSGSYAGFDHDDYSFNGMVIVCGYRNSTKLVSWEQVEYIKPVSSTL